MRQGLKLTFFFREPNCIFKSHLKVLCIETSTSLGYLQKFEGAVGEFKGALGSRHPLISSPVRQPRNLGLEKLYAENQSSPIVLLAAFY